MAGSWDLCAQQCIVWPRALTGHSSSPTAPRERGIGESSGKLREAPCSWPAISEQQRLKLLPSCSLETAVQEQWLDRCSGQGYSGTQQEVTYRFRKGQAHLSVAGLRSSLESLREEIHK